MELDRDSSVEGEEEEDNDAAFARRLQEAEDREHYRRLLELHGAGAGNPPISKDAHPLTLLNCLQAGQSKGGMYEI